jgi:hypothetical protein
MNQCSDNAIFVVLFRDVKLALMAAGALEFGEDEEGDLFGIVFIGLTVSAGMRLIQPIALAWLSPTPAIAVSEMPTGESQSLWSLIAVDQDSWRLKGIKICTSHRLDRKDKQFSIFSVWQIVSEEISLSLSVAMPARDKS